MGSGDGVLLTGSGDRVRKQLTIFGDGLAVGLW